MVRVLRREEWRRFAATLACGLMFGVLGSMLGDGIQQRDTGDVIGAGVALVLLSVVYWLRVLGR